MPALKFTCKTNSKKNHEEIKRKTYFAGGDIVREKVRRDTSSEFDGEFEIMSEGGTLYRDVKESGLTTTITIITE